MMWSVRLAVARSGTGQWYLELTHCFLSSRVLRAAILHRQRLR